MAAQYTPACTEEHTVRPKSSKRWLARQLLKPVPGTWQSRRQSPERPRTAPSTGFSATLEASSLPSLSPVSVETRHVEKAPSRPPRLEPGVVRHINAWLDVSNKPDTPLMGGVRYWKLRQGSSPGIGNEGFRDEQYAISIRDLERRGESSSSQPLKSFCRRAKRIQVRMPSLQLKGTQKPIVQKKMNRRSASVPLLATPYEATEEGPRPVLGTWHGSMSYKSRPATKNERRSVPDGSMRVGSGVGAVGDLSLDQDTTDISRDAGHNMERQPKTALGQGTRVGYSLQQVPLVPQMAREDSMCSLQLSDAPTYFTGPAPPSYRSRAASILTTSSFGCVDGMNPAQRQLSQEKAQRRRGVKGKLKKLAQKALFTR